MLGLAGVWEEVLEDKTGGDDEEEEVLKDEEGEEEEGEGEVPLVWARFRLDAGHLDKKGWRGKGGEGGGGKD